MNPRRTALALLLFALLPLSAPIPAVRAQGDEEDLRRNEERAAQTQEEVTRLAAREKDLARKIAGIEDRVRAAEKEIAQRQKGLDTVRTQERRTREDYVVLEQKRTAIVGELRGLLGGIWPVHLQNLQSRFQGLSSWEAVDRRFTWMSAVYGATRAKLDEARQASARIAANLEIQKRLAAEAETRLARVNESKDVLLREKLTLRQTLNQVRSERQDLETELAAILATIKELNYQMGGIRGRHFEAQRRQLPWPARGRTVAAFAPDARPPHNGIGLSLSDGAPVKAVFWGKVVHNDVLRGFGRVVILYHGDDYYSLYAFLADSNLRTGQEVEKDETVGHAGYYPEAQGPGLYFELRFHQKPINPDAWFAATP